MSLIDFNAEVDTVLKNHLDMSTVFKETSKTTQNELLQTMLEVCHKKVSDEIKQVNCLAVITDETNDLSK